MAAAAQDWAGRLAQGIASADTGHFWIWTAVLLTISVGGFVFTFLSLHKARLMENTPTSRIRSAAQGYVELKGYARLMPGPDIVSPLSGARCTWWQYKVERRETVYRNGKRRSEWRTIAAGTSESLFLLVDDTGDCVVDPQGATIRPSLRRQWRGRTPRPERIPEKPGWLQSGDYRYTERLLQVGDPLYALGWFRSQGQVHEYQEAEDLRELLREWKADHADLVRRFDANGDGLIDAGEWETVRRTALEAVRQDHVARSLAPDIHVLCRPRDRRPFLLSTLPQEALARSQRIEAAVALLVSLASGSAGVFALAARSLL